MTIQIIKSKSLDKRNSNMDRNAFENELSGENEDENAGNEESKNQNDSASLNHFKLEKCRSHYVNVDANKNKIGNLNQKINKIKSLDENKKKTDKYVIELRNLLFLYLILFISS